MAGVGTAERFQLVLLQPEGFAHAESVREIAEGFREGFAELGLDVPIRVNHFDEGARPILFCAQHLPPERERLLPDGTIIYNAEQLVPGYPWATPAYLDLLSRHLVWDFSARNVDFLRARTRTADVRHVPIGYADGLSRIAPADEDIDVLFFGALSERRMAVLRRLAEAGMAVHALTDVFGAARDAFIARAKVVLNMHFAPGAAFESARVLYLLANGKAVVCEAESPDDIPAGLRAALVAAPYGRLAEAVRALVGDAPARAHLAAAGRLAVRAPELRASAILRQALDALVVPDLDASGDTGPAPPFVAAKAAEAELSRLLTGGEHEKALRLAMAEVARIRRDPRHVGRAVYLPGLDRQVGALGDALGEGIDSTAVANEGPVLIVATELYATGGHSRVLADIVEHLPGPVWVVLTDAFGNYAQGRAFVSVAPGEPLKCPVLQLPGGALADKVRNLKRTVANLAPRAVFLLAHHEDVVAYAACSPGMGARTLLIHHCDHHPALGSTCGHHVHVDITHTAQRLCADHLSRATEYLPLYAGDRGVKHFSYPLAGISTVTSGSSVKFSATGPLAYHEAVATLLGGIDGRHIHIGDLPDDYLAHIRAVLAGRGIDAARFTHIPAVASLWQTLKEIDACIYVTSFPVGGNRALFEAIGCGYPAAAFLGAADQPFLRHGDDFGAGIATWEDPPSLLAAVRRLADNHAEASEAARRNYLDNHCGERFAAALRGILG